MNLNKKIRVLINGAFGKMGTLATRALEESLLFEIVYKAGRQDNLNHVLEINAVDLVLDLTQADCIFENCKAYLHHQIKFVIGASGLQPKEMDHISQVCQQQQLGGLIVPNFSIGSVLSTYFAKLAAKWFDAVEIIEMHHHLKIDSPSGTAIHTAQEIHKSKSQWPKMNTKPQAGREYFNEQIPIHAIRMPGILAMQQILLGQMGETINIQHQIIDRQAYMPGLLLACKQVISLKQLHIGLERWLIP